MIRLKNHSPVPFRGWKRVTINDSLPFRSGVFSDSKTQFVVGSQEGVDTHVVDIQCELQPGEEQQWDIEQAVHRKVAVEQPWPADLIGWLGGTVRLNGRDMQAVSLEVDGAAVVAHMRRRVGRMFCVDLWIRWYPIEPWAEAEAVVTASNPATHDLFENAPDLRVTFGDAIVDVYGRGVGASLVPQDTQFADGQARAVPLTFAWPKHMRGSQDWASAAVVAYRSVSGVGITQATPFGNPVYPADFDVAKWVTRSVGQGDAVLHTWAPPALGIAPNSGQTGSQEGQQFVRGEALLDGSAGAEWATYLSACKFANRPCHHLEMDGRPIDVDKHPSLIMWNGRPLHQGSAKSPDMLGKPRGIPAWDVPGGWYGPDRQHRLMMTLAMGARQTGSRALHYLLEHQARLWLLDYRTDSGNATTDGPGSARSPFYEGWSAVLLHHNLRDRELAERIRVRMRERVLKSYMPAWGNLDVWHKVTADSVLSTLDRNTYQQAWMPYQQALGAWGLWAVGKYFDISEARHLAVQGAEAVTYHAWRWQPDGQWFFWDFLGYTGSLLAETEYVEGKGGHRTGWYESTWAIPGLAVLLEHNEAHQSARWIWQQVVQPNSWVPPGMKLL